MIREYPKGVLHENVGLLLCTPWFLCLHWEKSMRDKLFATKRSQLAGNTRVQTQQKNHLQKVTNRFVATRVVERVYFEMPNTPSTVTPDHNLGLLIKNSENFSSFSSPSTPTKFPKTVGNVEKELKGEIEEKMSKSTVTCSPRQHVLFLKTHKTGSSTITNILNRYADWNNLTVLLPKSDDYYSFDWPNKFRLNFAKNLYGTRPNVLANHARYSRKSMNVLFPRESSFYLTVLRHPIKQWESTFNYMSFPYILNIMKKDDPLDFFLSNPPSYENIIEIGRRFPSLYLIKNPQFFDLGFDYKYYDNETMIKRAIRAIDRDFNIVLLMEYFDESLTLLKRRLCWEIDDVVYFKMNERLNKNKRKKLTLEQKRKIYQWNNADVALYEYFSKKFWKEVEKEGKDFYKDLAELQQRKKYYFKTCIEKEAIEEAYTAVFVKGFAMRQNLTGNIKIFCERMLRNELNYQDIFKDRRREWLENLAGLTIENFDEETEMVDVNLISPISTAVDGTGYKYSRPTKRPKTSPSAKETSTKKGNLEADFKHDATKPIVVHKKPTEKQKMFTEKRSQTLKKSVGYQSPVASKANVNSKISSKFGKASRNNGIDPQLEKSILVKTVLTSEPKIVSADTADVSGETNESDVNTFHSPDIPYDDEVARDNTLQQNKNVDVSNSRMYKNIKSSSFSDARKITLDKDASKFDGKTIVRREEIIK